MSCWLPRHARQRTTQAVWAVTSAAQRKRTEAVQELSARTGGAPQARATIALFDAIHHYNLGLWSEALRRYSEAERILIEECHGLNWELSFARTGKLWTPTSAGSSVRLQEDAPRILDDAVQRWRLCHRHECGYAPFAGHQYLSAGAAEARETVSNGWRVGHTTASGCNARGAGDDLLLAV